MAMNILWTNSIATFTIRSNCPLLIENPPDIRFNDKWAKLSNNTPFNFAPSDFELVDFVHEREKEKAKLDEKLMGVAELDEEKKKQMENLESPLATNIRLLYDDICQLLSRIYT